MNFYVTLKDNSIKKLQDVVVGDLLLCDDNQYHSVKSILITSCTPLFCRLSNGFTYYLPDRMLLKTIYGFKKPELWDILKLENDTLTPQIVSTTNITRIMFFHDILIDGNIVTPEGIVFKYAS